MRIHSEASKPQTYTCAVYDHPGQTVEEITIPPGDSEISAVTYKRLMTNGEFRADERAGVLTVTENPGE